MDALVEKDEVVLDLLLRIYPLESILSACYRFVDRCYVFLDQPETRKIRVSLKPKQIPRNKDLSAIVGEFSNELLHQSLRLKIAARTSSIREMVVGRALLSAEPMGIPQEEDLFDSADYLEDPLGIAVPWEEKYGKQEGEEKTEEGEPEKQ